MNGQISAISLDVGGTLIEPWPSVGHIYASIAERHGYRVAPEVLNQQFKLEWKALKDFQHGRDQWAALVDASFRGLDVPPPSASFFPDIYEEFTRAKSWHVFPDVVPTLTKLQAEGVRLAVVSNWDERLRPLLAALNLDSFFEVIIISCEVGHSK